MPIWQTYLIDISKFIINLYVLYLFIVYSIVMWNEVGPSVLVLSYDDIKETYAVLLKKQNSKDIVSIFETTNVYKSIKGAFGKATFQWYQSQSLWPGLWNIGVLSVCIKSNDTTDIITETIAHMLAIPADKIRFIDDDWSFLYTIRTGPNLILRLTVQKTSTPEHDEIRTDEVAIWASSSNVHVIHDYIRNKIQRFASLWEVQSDVPKNNYKKSISFYVPVVDPFEDELKDDILNDLWVSPKDVLVINDLNKRTLKYTHPTSKYHIFIYLCSEAEPIQIPQVTKTSYKPSYKNRENTDIYISDQSTFGDKSYDKRMAWQIPTVGYVSSFDSLWSSTYKTWPLARTVSYDVYNLHKQEVREAIQGAHMVEEHKLNPFLKIGNVWYINNSKSSNLNSTRYALETLPGPMIWVVGGINKWTDLLSVQDTLWQIPKDKIHSIIYIGVEKDFLHNLESVFKSSVQTFFNAENMQEVANLCHQLTKAWQCTDIKTVVLSPGAASFDRFQNFEDRGRKFMHAVRDRS